MDLLHGCCVSACALLVVRFVSIAVEDVEGIDEIALPLRSGFGGLRLIEQLLAAFQIRFCWTTPKLVIEAHGLSPVRHRALGILSFYFLELLARLFISKRVEQSNTALKGLLCWARARNGKRNRAQLLVGV